MIEKLAILLLAPLTLATTVVACSDKDPGTEPTELNLKLDFAVTETGETSATVGVTPSDDDAAYYWSVVAKPEYDALGGHDALKNGDMDHFRALAGDESTDPATIIARESSKGAVSETITDLAPDAEYVVYGYAITPDGNTGDVSETTFRTEAVTAPPASLQIAATVDGMTRVEVTVTPENIEVLYCLAYATDEIYESWGGTAQGLINHFNSELAIAAAQSGKTEAEVLATMWQRGVFTRTYRYMNPGTTYHFYAVELTAEGEVTGIQIAEAATAERQMVDTTFEIDVEAVSQTSATIRVTPSDKEQNYFRMVFTRQTFEMYGGGTDEGFMDYLVSHGGENGLDEDVTSGDIVNYANQMPIDTEFVVVVFAYDETWVSPLHKAEFKTDGLFEPSDVEIEIELLETGATMGAAYFWVNDVFTPIHFQAVTRESVDGLATDKEKVEAAFGDYITAWYNNGEGQFTRQEVIAMRGAVGQQRYTLVNNVLIPETDYYFWAGVFDPATEELLSEPFLVPFRTGTYVQSDATATPVVNKYFRMSDDGIVDPVHLGGPTYDYPDSVAIVWEDVETTGATTWYGSLFKGDYTDQDEYPDWWFGPRMREMAGTYNICQNGPEVRYINNPYAQWTLLAVAVGADGNYGDVYRRLVTVTAEGCSPASEFPRGIDMRAPVAPAAADPMTTGVADVYGDAAARPGQRAAGEKVTADGVVDAISLWQPPHRSSAGAHKPTRSTRLR
jgi:hypothetical protein